METDSPYIGIDFGTTNTVVALAGEHGPARLISFPTPTLDATAFRSCLSFHNPSELPEDQEIHAGPWAIEAFAEDPVETRLLQSFKTFAAQESFTDTRIQGRRYRFEDLLSIFLRQLRDHAGGALEVLPERVVIGRPVTFAGAAPNEALALQRYEEAFRRLGVKDIRYAFEPVGAAFFFARELTQDATVLVGDFGGGTSDFSIIRFERQAGELRGRSLGRAGVGLAGDAFDYRIIDRLVSPALGKGSDYRSFGKTLPIPNRWYSAFARWDHLALMRGGRDLRDIRRLVRDAVEPEKLERLVEVLDQNYGYRLYQSVSALKEALSFSTAADFRFEAGSIAIAQAVTRADFESWIAPELTAIERAVDAALQDAQLGAGEIDRVFLTGGTSLVPAVRDIFHRRFEPSRIETGAELESIASGLALISRERDISAWTSTPSS